MTRPVMQRTAINGVELAICDSGSGEPVLFVHGGMGDECAAVLSEPALATQYRLIDYHRRGYGNSACPDVPGSIAQQAADCRALMRHLGVGRAHGVGQSYGGIILLQLALDAPDVIHSLALLEPALPSVLFNAPAFGAMGAQAATLYASGEKARAIDTFAQEVAGADYRTVFDRTLPPGYFDRWVAEADAIFQHDIPALQGWAFTREDAAQITQPVLNMTGAKTRPYFREIYDTIQEWLPQAVHMELPNATHTMLQMNPQGAAECLASFFARHRLSG